MMAGKPSLVLCPICAAENLGSAAKCFLCGQSLVGAVAVAAKKPGEVSKALRPRFRLNSIMLLIALIAVGLGLARSAPGLAVLFAIPAVVGLIRTVVVSGDRDTWDRHLAVFALAFGAVFLAMIAGCVAFLATCTMIASVTSSAGLPALVLGGLAGLAIAIWLTLIMVRKVGRKRES